jgi:AAA15 family ATPase/GTPase
LSDGTLRFLALSVLSLDPDPQGVICLEEPENGIHPERIPAMIQLLRDLTTDVENNDVEDGTRALRQVIINTHSPSVVMQVPDDSLLVAELVDAVHDGRRSRVLQLRCLADTWRDKVLGSESISKGQLLAYLNPVSLTGDDTLNGKNGYGSLMNHARQRRVIDREDLQQYKIPFDELAS